MKQPKNVTSTPVSSSGITRDDWLSALKQADEASLAPRDPSVLTMGEFSVKTGLAETTARQKMRGLVAAGYAKIEDVVIRTNSGGRKRVLGYRLIKK